MARHTQLLLGAAVMALVLASASALRDYGLGHRRMLDRQIGQLEQSDVALAQENARLRREIRALDGDPKAVERAAREQLGLVEPGEVVFTF